MTDFSFLKSCANVLEVILSSLPQEVIFIDNNYNILWFNQSKAKTHPQLKCGDKCYRAFNFSAPCEFCLLSEASSLGQALKNPVCLMTGKHRNIPRHINISLIPIELKDQQGFLEIVDNVEALYQSNAELERLNQEYENVIYTLSHDLRSPLVSIEGFVRKLEKAVLAGDTATLKHCLERIHANTQNMNALLNVLLDTSRIITGLLDLKENDMGKIASEIAAQFAALAAEQNARIVLKGDFKIEICDRIRIQQVYANLVGNALKHCQDTKDLVIELGAKDHIYWVADNGPGIPANFLDLVFEPFTRANKNLKESFGLGMNIVYRIIQKHKGEIWIESESGKGTTVFFSLKT